jgi:hypothetical protein
MGLQKCYITAGIFGISAFSCDQKRDSFKKVLTLKDASSPNREGYRNSNPLFAVFMWQILLRTCCA